MTVKTAKWKRCAGQAAVFEAANDGQDADLSAVFGGRFVPFAIHVRGESMLARDEMLSPLLAILGDGESLCLELAMLDPAGPPVAGIRGVAAARDSTRLSDRRKQLGDMLSALMRGQMPGLTFHPGSVHDAGPIELGHETPIRPRGRRVSLEANPSGNVGPKLVGEARPKVLLPSLAISPERFSAAIDMLRARGEPALIRIGLRLSTFDAPARRMLVCVRSEASAAEPQSRIEALRYLAETVPDDALMSALIRDGGGVRLDLSLLTKSPLDQMTQRMLCHAIFGAELSTVDEEAELDLACTYPRSFALGRAVQGLAAVAMMGHERKVALYEPPASYSVLLGTTATGQPVAMTEADRDMHAYIIGATGTGKSTLVLNQIRADMQAGHGLIVLDPHGDLWEMARALVPEARRKDLVLGHLGDPAFPFSLNVLQSLGGDPAVERSAAANGLLRLFMRTLWVDVQLAFGPMFEQYFRNGILLLMEAQGEKATVLDFERIFYDEDFRDDLLARCETTEVRDFWQKTAANVTSSDHNLESMAPYVTSKMSPFTTNAALRPMLAAETSSLDLIAAIRDRRIVLINLAKGIVGEGAARLAGGLITMRLVASAQTQMRLAASRRQPFNAYLDEFQNYATEHLAEAIAETRKFKLRLVLACQSLGQIDGRAQRPDVAQSILANVANLIAFRLGVSDAHVLAQWFAPAFTPEDLMYLPNFRAVGRFISGGNTLRPVEFRASPPPRAG